jgi:hypothetical protein
LNCRFGSQAAKLAPYQAAVFDPWSMIERQRVARLPLLDWERPWHTIYRTPAGERPE